MNPRFKDGKLDRVGLDWGNVFYAPEKFGLEEVAQIDYSSGSYEFDYRVVWKDEEGRLWTARDSGCSCPSPFEDVTELERLTNLDELYEECKSSYYNRMGDWELFSKAVQSALDALKDA